MVLRKLEDGEKYILRDLQSGDTWDLDSTDPDEAMEEGLKTGGFAVSIKETEDPLESEKF